MYSFCPDNNDSSTLGMKQMIYFKIAYKYPKTFLELTQLVVKYKRFINNCLCIS